MADVQVAEKSESLCADWLSRMACLECIIVLSAFSQWAMGVWGGKMVWGALWIRVHWMLEIHPEEWSLNACALYVSNCNDLWCSARVEEMENVRICLGCWVKGYLLCFQSGSFSEFVCMYRCFLFRWVCGWRFILPCVKTSAFLYFTGYLDIPQLSVFAFSRNDYFYYLRRLRYTYTYIWKCI